ncbi:MAG: type II secretion system minor pseudopilin GspK [Pseudomonadota bacterium]
MTRFHRQRGAALLIVLIVAALASVLAVSLIERGQSTLARTQALMDNERAYQYALGMDLLARDLIRQAQSESSRPDLLNGAWTPPFEVPGGRVQGRLLDQQARFNLNALGHPDGALRSRAETKFERLLDALGLDGAIALELVDWIDGATVARPGSAGNSVYAGFQPPYRLAGVPMAHPSELRWLRSMTPEAYRLLSSHTTVLPTPDLRINVNTTTAPVLASLIPDMTLSEAERVLADGPWREVRGFLAHPLIQARPVPGLEQNIRVTSTDYLAQARVTLDGIERDYFGLIQTGGTGYDFRWFSQGVP